MNISPLLASCIEGRLDDALAAIADGDALDEVGFKGRIPLSVACEMQEPMFAIELQIAAQERMHSGVWHARDGSNVPSLFAMSGNVNAFLLAARHLPDAILDREYSGMNPLDLFCESCAVNSIDSPMLHDAMMLATSNATTIDLISARGSYLRGLDIADSLRLGSFADSAVLAIIERRLLALSLPLNEVQTDGPSDSEGKGEGKGKSRRL